MVSLKVQKSMEGTVVLAACDKELLGQKFEEGELVLHVSEEFYGGEVTTLDVLGEKLKNCHVANLVGERVVGKAKELGLIEEAHVMKIGGVPHAQYFNMVM